MHLFERSTALGLGLAAFAGTLGGCYSADFDGSANDVFACEANEDCPGEMACVINVCLDNAGPDLQINGPEDLNSFSADTTQFNLALIDLSGEPFELGAAGEGDGHVRIWVDGNEAEAITSGSLSQGVTVPGVNIPEPAVGVHRIRAIVFDSAGKPLGTPNSVADRVFFVSRPDDGPQIAVIEPFPKWESAPAVPRDFHPVGTSFPLVIASSDLTWTDPSDEEQDGEGHTHVYLLDDYPDCLPGCNDSYVGSLKPANSDTTDPRLVNGEAAAGLPTEPTRVTVTAGLQWSTHTPYNAPSLDEQDWDEAVREALVNDAVEIEFTAAE